tara:strand:+ start:93341 stop:94639 length:1299 start_codon:yes stop_codon:yes gene_type:complete
MTNPKVHFAALAIVAMLGCNKKGQDDEAPASATPVQQAPPAHEVKETPPKETWTWYRVRLASVEPRATVPFFLKVPSPETKGAAEIRVGEESLQIPITWRGASSFELDFEIFPVTMKASLVEDQLVGSWIQDSGSWGRAELAFEASVVADPHSWRLFPGEAPPVKAAQTSANWRLEMPDSGLAQLSLSIEAESAHGTILFESGNRISLAGRVGPSSVNLAGFDGTSAYVLTAKKNTDSALQSGQWLAGPSLAWQETFVGESASDFELTVGPTVAAKKSRVQITGVDLKGYAGKPTIIELAGSWCITCRYAAPFLREIYAELHPKGLEMLTLAYEFTDDEDYNDTQAREFKEQYSVDWEVTAVHGAPDSFDDIMPKGFKGIDVSGFPISIFVDREGYVTHVHAGFPASKNSEDYKKVTREYRDHARQLLAPKP